MNNAGEKVLSGEILGYRHTEQPYCFKTLDSFLTHALWAREQLINITLILVFIHFCY